MSKSGITVPDILCCVGATVHTFSDMNVFQLTDTESEIVEIINGIVIMAVPLGAINRLR